MIIHMSKWVKRKSLLAISCLLIGYFVCGITCLYECTYYKHESSRISFGKMQISFYVFTTYYICSPGKCFTTAYVLK